MGADVNRGDRPLSPHLQIYRPQITSVLSILHRATGVALTVSAALVAWWFLAGATGAAYFELVDGFLASWLGGAILLASAFGLAYHFFNGIRHLVWDAGYGYDLGSVTSSGRLVVIASVVATVALWLIA